MWLVRGVTRTEASILHGANLQTAEESLATGKLRWVTLLSHEVALKSGGVLLVLFDSWLHSNSEARKTGTLF